MGRSRAHDLLSGEAQLRSGPRRWLRLEPEEPAGFVALRPWVLDFAEPCGSVPNPVVRHP